LLSQIPPQTALHAPLSVGAVPSNTSAFAPQPPTAALNNLNLQNQQRNNDSSNEKTGNFYAQQQNQTPQPPPPAYNTPPPAANWPALAQATALYAYTSPDAGDLELQPNDQISVTEYLNAEWWKGKNTRTGREGIFPRSYVKVNEEKGAAPANPHGNNYGNAPLEVSQVGNGTGEAPNKGSEMVCYFVFPSSGCFRNIEIHVDAHITGQEVWQEARKRRHLRRGCHYRWQHCQQYFLGFMIIMTITNVLKLHRNGVLIFEILH
jgi:hypothetical protein